MDSIAHLLSAGALPAIRNIDIFPVEHEGDTCFCAQDPSGIVEHQLILSYAAAFIAAQLDGKTSLEGVRGALVEQFGGAAFSLGDIAGVVAQLDSAGFLETASYQRLAQETIDAFRARHTRPAHFAGRSYPADADALRVFLDEQFIRPGSPGVLISGEPGNAPLPGLVVPHIDFPRGGHAYAHGYSRLFQSGRPHTAVVFGVAHAAEPVPFIFTRKAFETPLGILEIDHDFLDAIEPACDFDPYMFEFTHRSEHSIEFQAVMLAHVFGTDVKIVPILSSHFIDAPHEVNDPHEPVTKVLRACREAVANAPYSVTVIASADLAHVGRRFGDPIDVDSRVLDQVRVRDDEDMAYVRAIEPQSFYKSVMRDHNARHVCGHNCIYSTLKTLEGIAAKGEALKYDWAADPAGGVVSFAAVALSR